MNAGDATPPNDVRVFGVVPAAGHARRMGRPKQCLPYGESTMTATVASRLLEAGCHRLVVVTRTPLIARLRLPDDPRIAMICNDAPGEMIDSIRSALTALEGTPPDPGAAGQPMCNAAHSSGPARPAAADSDGILVTPADAPAITASAFRRCIETFKDDPGRIVVATHRGRRGHPLIFPFQLRAEVAGLTSGLNEIMTRRSDLLLQVEIESPAVLEDVDTPELYRSSP